MAHFVEVGGSNLVDAEDHQVDHQVDLLVGLAGLQVGLLEG